MQPKPLQTHELFRSQILEETQQRVGDVFCPHRLRPTTSHGVLDARMHHAKLTETSSLNFLRYGIPVTVEPGPLTSFFNVQIQVSGSVETRCGSQLETISVGEAAILSPSEFASMNWSENAAMLIFTIDRAVVEHKLSAILGQHLPRPVVFSTRMSQSDTAAAGWLRAVDLLRRDLDGAGSFLNYPNAKEGFVDNLVLSLLYGHPHNYTAMLDQRVPMLAPAHVRRVESFIHENFASQIRIDDLVAISGASARSLYAGFRRFRSTTPMKLLRDVRLDRARSELQKARRLRGVTEIAGRCGFTQFGRFAAAYRARFGELPSETLKVARR